MKLGEWIRENRSAILGVTTILALAGASAATKMPTAIFPELTFQRIAIIARREKRLGIEVTSDVTAAALHEVRGKSTPVSLILATAQIFWEARERGIEQRQQGTKGFFLAAVRSRGDKDEVALGITGESAQQLMTLVAASGAGVKCACMCLVDDDQLWTGPQEFLAPAVRLDEICRHDDVRVDVKQ